MKIEVFTEEDYYDCETCGGNSESGGYVLVDGKEVFRHDPLASCYDNNDYYEDDLLMMALKYVGIEVTIDGSIPSVYQREQEG